MEWDVIFMVFTRRRVLAPLLLLATALTLLSVPRRLTLDRILYQRGCVITEQEDFALTLTLPKSRLPAGVPEEQEAAFAQRTELRLPAWTDGASTLYLDGLYYANEGPDQLYACFSFDYDPHESGQIVLPYSVNLDRDGATASFLSGGPSPADRTAFDDVTAYPGAVALRATGPGEELTFYVDTAVFQAAEGDLTFHVEGLTALRYRPA